MHLCLPFLRFQSHLLSMGSVPGTVLCTLHMSLNPPGVPQGGGETEARRPACGHHSLPLMGAALVWLPVLLRAPRLGCRGWAQSSGSTAGEGARRGCRQESSHLCLHPECGFFSVSSSPRAHRRLGPSDQCHCCLAQPLDAAL